MSQLGIRKRFRISEFVPCASVLGMLLFLLVAAVSTDARGRSFTVTDEIGLTLFDNPFGASRQDESVRRSPDGNYFAVWSERGRLDVNQVEDSLRFYRRRDVEAFLKHPDAPQPLTTAWIVNRSAEKGTVIRDWRWLPDSSAVAFVEGGGAYGAKRLVLADLRSKVVEPLTSTTEVVRAFDVRDREHYVYTAVDAAGREAPQRETQGATTIGTGHSLFELLFPDEYIKFWAAPRTHLWAVTSGQRLEITQGGAPVDAEGLALSPDGSMLVTALLIREFPPSWETLYAPPNPSSPFRIRRGEPAHQYVRINLKTGSIESLTDAPSGVGTGWDAGDSRPRWSSDGQAILLPDTFLSAKDHQQSNPCVAVVDLPSATRTCVVALKGETDGEGYHSVQVIEARFAGGNKERVIVTTHGRSYHSAEFRHTVGSTWRLVAESEGQSIEDGAKDLEVLVRETLAEPPQLVARDKETSRVIWNPNPQLDRIELGHANVYKWKDNEAREWEGGLYEPAGYQPGKRYPLVIQTHGFNKSLFRPSGLFPTASAARALAAAGMFVLQVDEKKNCSIQTSSEGACPVAGYESAVKQLVSEGKVDAESIGIIGFSRSCYWVIEALTTSAAHFNAALLTDGWLMTHFEYIATIDLRDDAVPRQFDTVIGAPPFGDGLQQWLRRSPGFNLDKINAALLFFAGEGRSSLLGNMWDAYAGLRYLHKPTDLIIFNTDEHVLTNPAMRLASQGGSVDWFRFWLQGYEDSDPAKAGQYRRWESLCDMQVEQNPHQAAVCVRSKTH
jgi:dipeptidyl aminopeptidase/acylaminoacyl peptidase